MDRTRELAITYLPLDQVHKNPWNPNRQDARTYQAERESIRLFGFIVPMLVRTRPEGGYEIIDGEHRHRGATEEGLTTGPAVVIDDLSEFEVRKLTIALNMHGEAEVVPMAQLLVELQAMLGDDPGERALIDALPFSTSELDELLKIGAIDWSLDPSAAQQLTELQQAHQRIAAASRFHVTLEFDKAQSERFDSFIGILQHELGEAFTLEEAILAALSGACQSL